MSEIKPYMINPESAFDTYCQACEKNDAVPIDELEFIKGLAIGLSGVLSVALKLEGMGMSKFPVDDDQKVWSLIVPCHDGVIRLIYGPLDGINETINNIQNSVEAVNDTMAEVEFSSIDQF